MEDVKKELQKIIKEKSLSQAAVSRAIGYDKGGSAVSQWLAGKYAGDNKRLTEAICGFIRREKEKAQKPNQEIKFVMTTMAAEGFDIAETCQLCGEMGVVIGEPGVGKTTFVKEYTKSNPGVILIETDVSYTTKGVFSELHQKCGGNGAEALSKMKDDIIDRLRDSGRLIICDEAEFLPVRAIDLMRRIYDKAGIGILFVGLPRLFTGLFTKHCDYKYILSRISTKAVMGKLNIEDVHKIVGQGGIKDEEVCEAFLEASGGNARKLRLIYLKCLKSRDYEPGMSITPGMIKQKAARLLI